MKRCLLLLFCFALHLQSFACACCAARGTYILRTDTITGYEKEVLQQLFTQSIMELYQTDAGDEVINGLADITTRYTVTPVWKGNACTINVRSEHGKEGALKFTFPARMTSYKVDQHPTDTSAFMVTLYKEWRLHARLTAATGIFRKTLSAPAACTIVFQGTGNMCDEPDNFRHWRFEVSGKSAAYAFFGALQK